MTIKRNQRFNENFQLRKTAADYFYSTHMASTFLSSGAVTFPPMTSDRISFPFSEGCYQLENDLFVGEKKLG